jgi:hypothetical protein
MKRSFNKTRIINWFIFFFLVFYYICLIFLIPELLIDDIHDVVDCLLYIFLFILGPVFFAMTIFKRLTLINYFTGFLIQWILFLNVNPYPIKNNNKMKIMNLIPVKNRPEFQVLLSDINIDEVVYPIIIKPIICSGGCNKVYIIESRNILKTYLSKLDNTENYMVQTYLNEYNVEVSILWEKTPWNGGRIIEIVEKTQDNNIRDFTFKSYKIHNDIINETINDHFIRLAKNIPGMNVCRYDIRLKHIADLESGDFKIIEVNGTMGMTLVGNPILWYVKRLFIGLYNTATFNGYSPPNLLFTMVKSYTNALKCRDWENIYSLYS